MMQRFDFVSHATRLRGATKELQQAWEVLGETWHDAVRERYQDRYLEPLRAQLQSTQVTVLEFAEFVDEMVALLADSDSQ